MVGRELLKDIISFCRPPILLPMMFTLMAIYLSGWAQVIGDLDVCWLCFVVGFISHCVFTFTPVHRKRSNWIKGRIKTKTRHYYAGHHHRTLHRIRNKLRTHSLCKPPQSSTRTFYHCLTASKRSSKRHNVRFDSDSFDIAIDNCASQCITNNKEDFIGTPKKVNHTVHGVGTAPITLQGTVSWAIEDDDGVVHDMVIKNCLFQ